MSKVYAATQSVGKFGVGEIVTGLTAERTKELLEAGAIEELVGVEKGADVEVTDYSDLTVPELKSLLEQQGIEFESNAKKADLIALLPTGEDNTGG